MLGLHLSVSILYQNLGLHRDIVTKGQLGMTSMKEEIPHGTLPTRGVQ